jgi:hypothetical protein
MHQIEIMTMQQRQTGTLGVTGRRHINYFSMWHKVNFQVNIEFKFELLGNL